MVGPRGQLKISPRAKIVDSFLSVGADAKLTVGDETAIEESKIFVSDAAVFSIGSGSKLGTAKIGVRKRGAVLSIGDRTRIGKTCHILADTSIKIGDFCLFAADILCTDSQNHSLDWKERRQEILSWETGQTDLLLPSWNIRSAPLTIESDCWFGRGASILVAKAGNTDGLRIGRGCVIGAGTVVKDSLPDFSLAVGVPANVIRRLSE